MLELTYSTAYGFAGGVICGVVGMVLAVYYDYRSNERRKNVSKNRR